MSMSKAEEMRGAMLAAAGVHPSTSKEKARHVVGILDDLIQAVRDDCAYATRHCDNYKCRDGTQEVVWHCPRCGNVGPTTAANLELAIREKTWPKKKNQAR